MRKLKLGEAITVKHGWSFKGEYFAENGSQSILTPGNFYEKGGFKANDGKERYYTGTYPKEYLCHKGDLIVAMTQQAEGLLGSTAIVPEDNRYLHNQRIGLITCDETQLTKLFTYYLFMTKTVREQLERSASGTKVKHTSPERIYDVEVEVPDLDSQNKISRLLLTIDHRIENNNHINDNLAQMAKTIYDYWFTQFDFPNTYNHPYCSSGGDMVWNDLLKQMIPAGWKVKRLNELCVLSLGGTPDTSNPDYWNGDINWLNSGEIAQFPVISSELKITSLGMKNSPAKLLPAGTVVVSITGNIRASIMAFDSCANQSVVGIHETDYLKSSYIYPMICNKLAYYTTISTGNCQKHINKGILDAEPVVIPSHNVLARYYSVVSPIYEEINQRAKETKELTDLRNWLLPMLMNGQATIED